MYENNPFAGKRIILLCGYIGSGKTTYAMKHYPIFTDLDFMPPMSRKVHQIQWTFNLLKKHDRVCHITCYPTPEELAAFQNIEKELIWINTSLSQARTNILIRNRPRDMENIGRVLKANEDYYKKITFAQNQFQMIEVFKR